MTGRAGSLRSVCGIEAGINDKMIEYVKIQRRQPHRTIALIDLAGVNAKFANHVGFVG